MMYEIIVYDLFQGLYRRILSIAKYKVGEIINGEYQVIECKSMEDRIYG